MRQARLFFITALITLGAFAAVLHSSCTKKNKCAGVTCENGGACANGVCSCATGYSGQHCELTSIVYQNNTHTDVALSLNGTTDTIAAGASHTIFGTPGNAATGTASTKGIYGNVYYWTINDQFPAAGYSFTDHFNVGSDYFFLEIANADAYTITLLTVNYGTPDQTVEMVSLVADRSLYGVGYYKAMPVNKVTVNFSSGPPATIDSIVVPSTINAADTLTIQ